MIAVAPKRPARDTGIIGGQFGWRRDRTVTHPALRRGHCRLRGTALILLRTTTRPLGTIRLALDLVVEGVTCVPATTSAARASPESPPARRTRGPLADQVGDEADPDRVEDAGVQALPDDARTGDPDDPVDRLPTRLLDRRLDAFGNEGERASSQPSVGARNRRQPALPG